MRHEACNDRVRDGVAERKCHFCDRWVPLAQYPKRRGQPIHRCNDCRALYQRAYTARQRMWAGEDLIRKDEGLPPGTREVPDIFRPCHVCQYAVRKEGLINDVCPQCRVNLARTEEHHGPWRWHSNRFGDLHANRMGLYVQRAAAGLPLFQDVG